MLAESEKLPQHVQNVPSTATSQQALPNSLPARANSEPSPKFAAPAKHSSDGDVELVGAIGKRHFHERASRLALRAVAEVVSRPFDPLLRNGSGTNRSRKEPPSHTVGPLRLRLDCERAGISPIRYLT